MRERLARHWVHEVVDGLHRVGAPHWVRLVPDLEEDLLDRTTHAEEGTSLAFDEATRQHWQARVRGAGDGETSHEGQPVVLVVSPRARRAAAELFRRSTPHVPVLSTAELDAADLPGQPVFSWVS